MIYHLLGLILLILGFTQLINGMPDLETKIIAAAQTQLQSKPWLPFFQEIWFFGRTSFTLISLLFLTAASWELGVVALLVFLIIVGIEQIIKVIFKRTRPYSSQRDIRMLQPAKPHDPSFPSGDALRVWYLALILPVMIGGPPIFYAGGIVLAILVSLGRIVMGVHYPTDVIAGTGLGFIGAGTSIWLWQILNLM